MTLKLLPAIILASTLISALSVNAREEEQNKYDLYIKETYTEDSGFFPLKEQVSDAGEVVIFFSFLSRESYELLIEKDILRMLNLMQYKVILYHVDFYSPFDDYIATQWYLADRYNLQDKIVNDFFKRLHSGRNPSSKFEIRDAFNSSVSNYLDLPRRPGYQYVTKEADAREAKRKRLMVDLGVTSVPSVYINGKFLINESVLNTIDESFFLNSYLPLVDELYSGGIYDESKTRW